MEVQENYDKSIYKYNKDMLLLCEYSSITEAYNDTGISISCISQCLHGRSKTSGGYIWIFKDIGNCSDISQNKGYMDTECRQCGKIFLVQKWRLLKRKNVFCSVECSAEFSKSKDLNCTCEICGMSYHRKQSHIDKNYSHSYCSIKCHKIAKETYMLGENNHQFGLKGVDNTSWKSNEKISHYGYRLIRCLNHPLRNCDDFVFEHRLVAEKYLLNEENSILINGIKYLKQDYVAHHKDFDRLNNDVSNLEVMTRSNHMKLHQKLKRIKAS